MGDFAKPWAASGRDVMDGSNMAAMHASFEQVDNSAAPGDRDYGRQPEAASSQSGQQPAGAIQPRTVLKHAQRSPSPPANAVSFVRVVKGDLSDCKSNGEDDAAYQRGHEEPIYGPAEGAGAAKGPVARPGEHPEEGAEDLEVPDRNATVSAPPDFEITSRALFAFKAGYTSAFTDTQQQQQAFGDGYGDFQGPAEPAGGPVAVSGGGTKLSSVRLPNLEPGGRKGMRREDSDASVEDLIYRTARMPPLSSSQLARDDSEISLTSLATSLAVQGGENGSEDLYMRERGAGAERPEGSKVDGRAVTGIPSALSGESWGGNMASPIILSSLHKMPDQPAPPALGSSAAGLYFVNPSEQALPSYGAQFAPFQASHAGGWMRNGRVPVEAFRPAFPAAPVTFPSSKIPSHVYGSSGMVATGYGQMSPELGNPAMMTDFGAFGRGMPHGGGQTKSRGVAGAAAGYPAHYEGGRRGGGGGGAGLNAASHSMMAPRAAKGPGSGGLAAAGLNGTIKLAHFSEAVGRVKELARDQYGCRYLQTKLEEGNPQYINTIFEECFEEFVALMIDPFGNYLCQKLFEQCDDRQKLMLVQYCADSLPRVSANMHGTRAVQRMVECFTTVEQIETACKALAPSAIFLMKDINGNHVIQRCLHRMDAKHNQFVYDAVVNNCLDLATHRHGCCVMQRCIDHASPQQKNQLVKQVTSNALLLVQNPYGNYVVQYVLELGEPAYTMEIIRRLRGHAGELSTQKFSSNVVEKCLQQGNAETRSMIIEELISDSEVIGRLLHDAYGNYVIQRSLQLAKSPQLEALCEAIRPHLASLKSTPYGKRIQTKILKMFPKGRGDREDFTI